MPAAGGAVPTAEPLLGADLLARLERLQVGTRRRLAGHMPAEHRSRRFGSSLDFADYREYHPGDDFRRIDYGAWARLDVLLVKLFEAEDDLTLRLLIDTSRSMAGPKLRQAIRLAAALGFVGLVRRDAVTVHTFPLDRPAPRFLGRSATVHLFAHLASLEAEGETEFAAATSHLLARLGPRGLTVVLSDLLTPEWDAGLERLPARGDEVAVVHVLDPDELQPTLSGDLDLVDRETGASVSVSLAADVVARYERETAAWLDRVEHRARRAGAAYLRVLSTDAIEPLLLGGWRRAGVLR
ncbi:MAG: DUF58 domain-containing protein [Acidimicrobiales bacterium]